MFSESKETSMQALAALTTRIRERNATIDALREKQDAMILEGVDGTENTEDELINSLAEREKMLEDARRLHQRLVLKLDREPQVGEIRTATVTSVASEELQVHYDDHESDDDERRIEILGMSILDLEQDFTGGIDDDSFADYTVDSIGLAKERLGRARQAVQDSMITVDDAPTNQNSKHLPSLRQCIANAPMPLRANTNGLNCAA